jgi:hypothetical protein
MPVWSNCTVPGPSALAEMLIGMTTDGRVTYQHGNVRWRDPANIAKPMPRATGEKFSEA